AAASRKFDVVVAQSAATDRLDVTREQRQLWKRVHQVHRGRVRLTSVRVDRRRQHNLRALRQKLDQRLTLDVLDTERAVFRVRAIEIDRAFLPPDRKSTRLNC